MALTTMSVKQGFPYYGGGQVPNPSNVIVATINPSNAATGNAIGTIWINKSAATSFIATQNTGINGSVTWEQFGLSTGTVGFLAGDSGGNIGPTGGGVININGTANQTTVTGNAGANQLVISLPSTMITPGTLEITGTLTVDGAGTSAIGTSNSATTVNIASGTGGNTVSINNGANTSANTTNIMSGNSAVNNTLNIMNGTLSGGTQALNIMNGTGTAAARLINLGTNGANTTITIGNNASSSGIAMLVGTGNFSLDGSSTATYAIAASVTTGTIAIGGTAGTGNMTFGSSSGTQTVLIANGSGAATLNLANGTTSHNATVNVMTSAMSAGTQAFNLFTGIATGGTQTTNINTGASASTVNIGNATGASATTITVGTGNFLVNGAVTSTYTIGTATGTGQINLGISTAAETIAIANAASSTGAQSVNILSGATPGAAQTINMMTGTYTTGSQTVNLITGTPSGGTQAVNILSGTSTGGTQTLIAGNIAQAANAVSLLSGSSGGLTFTSGTASNVLLQAGGTYWGQQGSTAPSAGYIGQQLITTVTSGAAITMTTSATVYNIATVNLTAGCWDVTGCVIINGTVQTLNQASISTATNTLGALGVACGSTSASAGSSIPVGVQTPVFRVNLASTTSYYLTAASTFGGSATGYGTIRAVRVA